MYKEQEIVEQESALAENAAALRIVNYVILWFFAGGVVLLARNLIRSGRR